MAYVLKGYGKGEGEGVQLYDTCLRQVASSSEMSAQYLLHTSFAAKAIRVKRILLHLGERNAYKEREIEMEGKRGRVLL